MGRSGIGISTTLGAAVFGAFDLDALLWDDPPFVWLRPFAPDLDGYFDPFFGLAAWPFFAALPRVLPFLDELDFALAIMTECIISVSEHEL